MKKALNAISAIDLLFILLICISSAISSAVVSDAVYYLSFVICALLGISYIRKSRPYTENERSVYWRLDKRSASFSLPLIFPVILTIICISLAATALASSFGISRDTDMTFSAITVITHAVIPAVAEEILFRYIPLKILLPYSRRYAILISALYFALVHNDLFAIPYAFAAGILFALIDEKCESVIPSVTIHFVNNLLSILLLSVSSESVQAMILRAILLLTLVSIFFIAKNKSEYSTFAAPLFEKREGEEKIGLTPLPLAAVSLTLALSALIF